MSGGGSSSDFYSGGMWTPAPSVKPSATAPPGKSASERFGSSAKAITSDQYFEKNKLSGEARREHEAKLSTMSGSTAITSDMYYGGANKSRSGLVVILSSFYMKFL